MKRLTILALAGVIALAGSAQAEPKLERVRGTIESAEAGSVSIKTSDGQTRTITIADDTKFAHVVKSSLGAIKEGVFIGTATRETEPPTAIEVVLFPESMRGTGEGHYPWDAIPDTAAGGGAVKSSMTNGTVKAGASKPLVKSSMTNATVQKSDGAEGGERTLNVTYDKDQSKTIVVPAKTPIVAFDPADKAILKPGGKIFVVAAEDGGKLTGKLVAVGKDGVTPPM